MATPSVLLCVCLAWHGRRTAFWRLQAGFPVWPARLRPYGTARFGRFRGRGCLSFAVRSHPEDRAFAGGHRLVPQAFDAANTAGDLDMSRVFVPSTWSPSPLGPVGRLWTCSARPSEAWRLAEGPASVSSIDVIGRSCVHPQPPRSDHNVRLFQPGAVRRTQSWSSIWRVTRLVSSLRCWYWIAKATGALLRRRLCIGRRTPTAMRSACSGRCRPSSRRQKLISMAR